MLSSNDFKFGHKLKHLEVDRTIEDGSLNVVEKITRVIMIFYANLQYLSVLLQKLRKIILFICSNHNANQSVSLWFKRYTYHKYYLKIYKYLFFMIIQGCIEKSIDCSSLSEKSTISDRGSKKNRWKLSLGSRHSQSLRSRSAKKY